MSTDVREFNARRGEPGFLYQLKEAEGLAVDVLAGQIPTKDPRADAALRRAACAVAWLARVVREEKT